MPPGRRPAFEAGIDRLFQAPLSEFVVRRNALAREAGAGGDQDAARRIRALAKPNASAWAINQAYWKSPRVFEALLDAGERARAAQRAVLEGRGPASAAQRSLTDRQKAIDAALQSSLSILESAGGPITAEARHRIVRTLEAISAHGRSFDARLLGRLTKDLDPPGFETFSGLAAPDRGLLRLVTPKREGPLRQPDGRQRELRARLARAETEVRTRRREAEGASASVARSESRAREARRAVAEAQERLEEAARLAAEAEREVGAAETRSRRLAMRLEQAERRAAGLRNRLAEKS